MFTDIDEFLKELKRLNKKFLSNAPIELVYKRIDKVSLRIEITSLLYVDVYYNITTKRFDFSLIDNKKRVFGFDNLKVWHYHPIDNPDSHIDCDEPSLQYVFTETAKVVYNLK